MKESVEKCRERIKNDDFLFGEMELIEQSYKLEDEILNGNFSPDEIKQKMQELTDIMAKMKKQGIKTLDGINADTLIL